jgi:hypothetical protein
MLDLGGRIHTDQGFEAALPDLSGLNGKVWFTAAELAELKLPGLSSAKRKINETAQAQRWSLRTDRAGMPLSRHRVGRGGAATEYHVAVLPPAASSELAKRSLIGSAGRLAANDGDTATPRGQIWSWFDQQSETIKAEAHRRMVVLDQVEALEQTGMTTTASVAVVASQAKVSAATLWEWRKLVAGVIASDRLPVLAPQRKGGGKTADVDSQAWSYLLSDYLRPERPTFASCYWRCLREYCAPRGLELPHQKTLARKLEKEVPAAVVTLKRHGVDALRNTVPAQQRTVADLHALELVNIDGHRWDVFVRWPDGHVARPMMVAIQDIYSRKFLAWRIDETESSVLTRLAFADLFRDWGIPKGCLMDNGRAFASKVITGGAKSRFRFSIKAEEPTGLLTSLGVKIHWALPFRGQSKPIERAFKDLCDTVAKHPAFAGAYTGNKVDAKPENYGEKAIDLETFKRVVQAGIDAHNARPNRTTETAAGRSSFDDVFTASYARAPIGKASPEQLRMALLASQVVSADRKDGSLKAYGNVWWSPAMSALAGQKVILRYDPDNLHSDVHVYGLDGRYLASAELQEKTGFLDTGAAHARARQEANLRKTTKAQSAAFELLTAAQLADMMPDLPDDADDTPVPTVIRPVRVVGNAVLKPLEDVQERAVSKPTPKTTHERLASAMERLRLVE